MRRILSLAVVMVAISVYAFAGNSIVIKAGKLLDPATGKVLENQLILVEGSKIKAVGNDITIPENAEIIDLSNMTVLPGLFDCHTHVCLDRLPTTAPTGRAETEALLTTAIVQSAAYRALRGAYNAKSLLNHGFTTIRDVGNAGHYADVEVMRAIKEGLIPGPTMIASGKIITPTGGQLPMVQTHEHPHLGEVEYIYADTRDEMVKAVRQNVLYGANVIKIVTDAMPFNYTVDDIRFIVEEAAKSGLKVAAHCLSDQSSRAAIEGGVASIEHGLFMSDETLGLAKQKGVVLVGTDLTVEAATTYAGNEQSGKQIHKLFVERLKRAHKAEVTMAFGSDVFFEVPGKSRGQATIDYIDSWVEAGIPPFKIIQCMIPNAARLLGIEKQRGQIREGMFADIIATSVNPLDDITTLKSVAFVMKNGQVAR